MGMMLRVVQLFLLSMHPVDALTEELRLLGLSQQASRSIWTRFRIAIEFRIFTHCQ